MSRVPFLLTCGFDPDEIAAFFQDRFLLHLRKLRGLEPRLGDEPLRIAPSRMQMPCPE
ncbi:hypothetical protein ACDP63_07395 [Paracoccus sp. P2]|uniref:hypothetical protein n=1 Tax=Paracoccus TaxID=265 RepID=UPI0004B044CD|nr:hypothetical protein [Paracoccus pantotrophus]MDF3854303.1 hypothetical protein [Paracoccus pantotrophus]SFO30687.1 hypothetical protein SAMN04244567_01343 [Paracoccus pantotrophus]